MPPLFGIVGWKNCGKTWLTVRLVEELTRRGYRIATIKHAHHDFDIDREGSDSWRHRQAGACAVAIASSRRFALIDEWAQEKSLTEIVARLPVCDLVFVEGYKHAPYPKIEVRRQEGQAGAALHPGDPHIVAVASDRQEEENTLPCFDLTAIHDIADFVLRHSGLLLPTKKTE